MLGKSTPAWPWRGHVQLEGDCSNPLGHWKDIHTDHNTTSKSAGNRHGMQEIPQRTIILAIW